MGCAVILHAAIGGGKTRTAESAAERAKTEGVKVMGILSRRVLGDGVDPSYNLVELDTNETMPLVKPARTGLTKGWVSLGNPRFIFSLEGLYSANLALKRAAVEMRRGVVVFVDEWGRLESQGKGIYSGAVMVAQALSRGGVAIYLCRDDKVGEVKDLFKGRGVKIYQLEAGDLGALLAIIRDCSKL